MVYLCLQRVWHNYLWCGSGVRHVAKWRGCKRYFVGLPASWEKGAWG